MQEILFRGFHKQADGPDVAIIDGVVERGKWLYGDFSYHTQDGIPYVFPADGYDSADFYEVIPSTVGQYTGLTDRNGKKIFDGDRVRVPMYRHTSTVPFFMDGTVTEGKAAFHVEWDDENCGSHFVGYLEGVEVIGTIYDTPPEGASNV